MTLELKKFDMRNISFKPDENKGPVIVLIGRRDTGKSFLVRDLLYYHQDIPIGTVKTRIFVAKRKLRKKLKTYGKLYGLKNS